MYVEPVYNTCISSAYDRTLLGLRLHNGSLRSEKVGNQGCAAAVCMLLCDPGALYLLCFSRWQSLLLVLLFHCTVLVSVLCCTLPMPVNSRNTPIHSNVAVGKDTNNKCKKLNSLKHLVRTTVAGSHN